MCGARPMVYLFGFPTPRPFGLPSHSHRLNGAGLTGHPCPGRPEIDVLSISPLTVRLFGATRSPKQINHQTRAERQYRCKLARCLTGGVG
jgi:hypothetical protein